MTKYPHIFFLTVGVLLLCTSLVHARFTIPADVYTGGQLDSAISVATHSKKPIIFIYSNKKTDCGLATGASKDLFKGFRNYCVMIYVEHSDWNRLPNVIQKGLNSPEAGKYIPKAVIVDHEMKKIIRIIPYKKTEQRRQLINNTRNVLSKM